jgi:hypothetical protein
MTTAPTIDLIPLTAVQAASGVTIQRSPESSPPTLFLPSRNVTVTESALKLFDLAAKSGRFFRRGHTVVRTGGNGTNAYLRAIDSNAACSDFETVGRLVTLKPNRTGQLIPQRDPMTITQAGQLLGCTDAVVQLPEIVGTSKVPILARTSQGPQLCGYGYSRSLKLWITADLKIPDVPQTEAVRSLRGLLSEFQFTTAGDESRAFASLITPMLHFGDWLPGEPVPVDVAEADQSQSGKTYRQKVVAAIYGAEPSYVNMKSRGVGGVDESIQSVIYAGSPFIAIDNLKGKVDSEYLEQTITNTTGIHRVRLPGMKEVEVRAKFILMISSNKAEFSRDMANRSVITRVEKKIGYEFTRNPLAEIESNPGYFLGCVATVVRKWAEAGCPHTAGIDHDFRAWAGAMDWIVQNLAGLPPLLDGHREAQARTADPILGALRQLALAIEESGDLDKQLPASRLWEIAADHEIQMPGVDTAPCDEAGRKDAIRRLGVKLGPVFRNEYSVTIDHFTIERLEDTIERDHHGPELRKFYRFTKGRAKT